ncbi:hypothetical protein PsorP6_003201 [Peronosclerospora sorghi]|uniref:Uncharacterized protein n=1 Tax=Peronosclerospora sorghi TaxID=230839 RepID=A0ACC0VP46_9STRA|nr:hypothetical protein PsorP6_003201 [Peronosclerospora sorghi]
MLYLLLLSVFLLRLLLFLDGLRLRLTEWRLLPQRLEFLGRAARAYRFLLPLVIVTHAVPRRAQLLALDLALVHSFQASRRVFIPEEIVVVNVARRRQHPTAHVKRKARTSHEIAHVLKFHHGLFQSRHGVPEARSDEFPRAEHIDGKSSVPFMFGMSINIYTHVVGPGLDEHQVHSWMCILHSTLAIDPRSPSTARGTSGSCWTGNHCLEVVIRRLQQREHDQAQLGIRVASMHWCLVRRQMRPPVDWSGSILSVDATAVIKDFRLPLTIMRRFYFKVTWLRVRQFFENSVISTQKNFRVLVAVIDFHDRSMYRYRLLGALLSASLPSMPFQGISSVSMQTGGATGEAGGGIGLAGTGVTGVTGVGGLPPSNVSVLLLPKSWVQKYLYNVA